jgi:hypothetical protein
MDEDEMTFDELRALMLAGEPVTINPGPRPVLATEPDWAALATVWGDDTRAWAEEATRLWAEDWDSPEDAVYDDWVEAVHDANLGCDS